MSLERLTVSELAVLRAIDAGARTCAEIADRTGAAAWWVRVNVDWLVRHYVVAYTTLGEVVRR